MLWLETLGVRDGNRIARSICSALSRWTSSANVRRSDSAPRHRVTSVRSTPGTIEYSGATDDRALLAIRRRR